MQCNTYRVFLRPLHDHPHQRIVLPTSFELPHFTYCVARHSSFSMKCVVPILLLFICIPSSSNLITQTASLRLSVTHPHASTLTEIGLNSPSPLSTTTTVTATWTEWMRIGRPLARSSRIRCLSAKTRMTVLRLSSLRVSMTALVVRRVFDVDLRLL